MCSCAALLSPTAADDTPTPPVFVSQPAGGAFSSGATVVLAATASGVPAPAYQWYKGTTPIAGATSAEFTLTNLQAVDVGTYTLIASNASGVTASRATPVAIAGTSPAVTYTVSTIAGRRGHYGAVSAPGPGEATFGDPRGVVVDSSGRIFVADRINGSIRRIDVDGTVSTFASGIALPQSLAIDDTNTLYVATGSPNVLYRVSAAGAVSTLFQWSGNENDYGIGEATSIAVNRTTGRVYITDATRNAVMVLEANGKLELVAGPASGIDAGSADGRGSAARFREPGALALDAAGNGYVCDTLNHTIRRITTNGTVSTFAGSAGQAGSTDGTGSAARFNAPAGIVVTPSGDLYVADTGNHTIRRITSAGVVTTVSGVPGTAGSIDGVIGPAAAIPAALSSPRQLALDASGNAIIADAGNQKIRRLSPAGVLESVAGLGSAGSADGRGPDPTFLLPSGIAVAGPGVLHVAGNVDRTVRAVSTTGAVTLLAGRPFVPGGTDGTFEDARFGAPSGLAIDATGHTYVADFGQHTVRRITPAGVVTTLAGSPGAPGSQDDIGTAARFDGPNSVALDGAGNLYVCDGNNNTVRRITPAGQASTIAGLAGQSGSADGVGSDARFNNPSGLCVAPDGSIYLADRANHTIRRIKPGGIVETIAGLAGSAGTVDGRGTAARFNTPSTVAMDAVGNLFVVERGNHTLRLITPARDVITVAGLAGALGWTDGTGPVARFHVPAGVTVDADGTCYIADRNNSLIRKCVAPPWFVEPPLGVAAIAGQPVEFRASVAGTGPFTYQWEKNNTAITGATQATLAFSSVTPSEAGVYRLRVSGPAGTTTSPSATLTVSSVPAPSVATQPSAQSTNAGGAITLSVTVQGDTPYLYQWLLDGVAIDGATGSSLVIPSAQLFHAGSYTVAITHMNSRTISTAAIVNITAPPASDARLVNLSTRALCQTGDSIVIPGFVISGTGTKRMLIRGVGPRLTGLGVPGALPDPILTLKRDTGGGNYVTVDANDNWSTNANKTEIIAVSSQVFAFSLPDGSKDSALLVDLPAGSYTVPTAGVGDTTGVSLVELYDADAGPSAARLVNISNRGYVGVGGEIMIPGFVVSNEGSRTFLIRAVGPRLAGFGVQGVLEDPEFVVYRREAGVDYPILSNDDWGTGADATQTAAVARQVFAFSLVAGSKDAAFVVTLPPGAYTVNAKGKNNSTGVALVEVYLVP